MTESPMTDFLQAADALDLNRAVGVFASGGRLLTVDGRRAEGREPIRALMSEFVAGLRSCSHRVTAEWHEGEVWIAEVEATYVLKNWLELTDLPRALILRHASAGIVDLRIYGSHERPLSEYANEEEGWLIGGRWVPPL